MKELSATSISFLDSLRTAMAGMAEPTVKKIKFPPQGDEDLPLRVAAVLHVFDPSALFGPEGRRLPPASPMVWEASYPAPGRRRDGMRSIYEDQRVRVLRSIGGPAAARALIEANPGRMRTAEQTRFETMLEGGRPQIEGVLRSQLFATRLANSWMRALTGEAPFSDQELLLASEQVAAVEPIAHLFSESFVGREDELHRLREFVGIAEPSRWRMLSSIFLPSDRRMLLLDGIGGVGKTALLGRFLHHHRNDEDGRPLFPFAYLTCDASGVDLEAPHGVLADAIKQFERIYRIWSAGRNAQPSRALIDARRNFEKHAAKFAEANRDAESRRSEFTEQGYRGASVRYASGVLAQAFAEYVHRLSEAMSVARGARPPVLLIVDSFEEAQYRAPEAIEEFWALLDEVLFEAKAFRILVAGRTPLDRPPLNTNFETLALDRLSRRDAEKLILKETRVGTGQARKIVAEVGRNPLNLRLAAQLIQDQKADGAHDIGGLRGLGSEMVRGVLYRRVLNHIHEPDVRSLAHPGMIVRRVTPEVIAQVLAPVCGLGEIDPLRAQELFEALKREHTLVRLAEDSSLRFRQDVRQPILKLLAADDGARVRDVHRAAAFYYGEPTDEIAAAEHIYHRLMLNDDLDTLGAAWRPEAQAYLQNAFEELPPEGQVWLAERMSVRLPDDVIRTADLASWERIVGPKAYLAMEHEGPNEALEILSERDKRTPESALFAIEARSLMSIGDAHKAEIVLRRALADYPANGNPGRRAELVWLLYQALSRSQPYKALDALRTLIDATTDLKTPIPRLQALAEILGRLPPDAEERPALTDALVSTLRGLKDVEIYVDQDVVRSALAQAPKETAPALAAQFGAVYTSIIDAIDQQRFDISRDVLREAIEILRIALESDAAGLARELLQFGVRSALEPNDLRKIVEICVNAIHRFASDPHHPEATLATKVLWRILQLEKGDFAAATLGGLEEYREDWERSASGVALA